MNNKPILGSHNTFTYLKPKNFLSLLSISIGKCQSDNILYQLDKGIRAFDIRVRFDNYGNLQLCHGFYKLNLKIPIQIKYTRKVLPTNIFNYKNFIDWLIFTIKTFPINDKIYFRFILEISKENIIQELYFKKLCEYFDLNKENNFYLLDCRRKFDWNELYKINNKQPIIYFQHISSYSKYNESIKVRWYEKFFPWLYAKRTNKYFLKNYQKGLYNNYDIVFYDFV